MKKSALPDRAASSPALPESDLPSGLGQPAWRALTGAGIWTLTRLSAFSEAEIKQLHGIGPKALSQLHRALSDQGLNFRVS